jgi:hypothetical protein
MLVTTQAVKQHYNPKDLNVHLYISIDILVLIMGEEMSSYWRWQIHALIVTPMGKKFIWECCFLQSFIHLQNGTHKVFILLK